MLNPVWAVLLSAALQQPEYLESRFHRIHLRNGNFIDGQVVSEAASFVTVRIGGGSMTVRRDLIERVEYVKIRSLKEAPQIVKAPEKDPEAAPKAGPLTPPKVAAERRKERGTDSSRSVAPAVRARLEELLDRMEKAPNEEKAAIGREIAEMGAETAVFLADALESLDAGSLPVVGGILGDLKAEDSVPLLQKALKSSRPEVRIQAAMAFGAQAKTVDGPEFVALLQDSNDDVKSVAIEVLGRLGVAEALDPISKLCSSNVLHVRQRAFTAAVEIAKKTGREDQIETLFRDTLDKTQGEARADTIMKIAQARFRAIGPLFKTYLSDDHPQVRAASAFALGQLGDRSFGDAVADRIASEDDKWTRLYLAEACVKLVARKGIDPLIEWLDDKDPEIRNGAVVALKQLTGANPGIDRAAWTAWRAQSPQK